MVDIEIVRRPTKLALLDRLQLCLPQCFPVVRFEVDCSVIFPFIVYLPWGRFFNWNGIMKELFQCGQIRLQTVVPKHVHKLHTPGIVRY